MWKELCCLLQVQAAGVPFCFVTNNGMESEAGRAERLATSLGMPVPAANMVLNHSGLQEAGASRPASPVMAA